MEPAHMEPPREQLLRKRVLPIDMYVMELRQSKDAVTQRLHELFGDGPVPIPVPLAPGETEAQYEERFQRAFPAFAATPTKKGKKKLKQMKSPDERATRIAFARRQAKAYKKAETQRRREETAKLVHATESQPTAERTRPEVLYKTQYVELEQFRRDLKSGVLATYKNLSKAEKVARFGVPVVPIFVPLARGETAQQYEARFRAWLEKKHATITADYDMNNVRERSLRMSFAMLNARGQLRFNPASDSAKREREDTSDSKLADTIEFPDQSAEDVESNHFAKRRKTEPRENLLMDLSLDDEDKDNVMKAEASPAENHVSQPRFGAAQLPTSDTIEEDRLFREFDEINDRIVLNLEALDAAQDALVCSPPADSHEMAKLQEENEEMRGLIDEECAQRTKALVPLVMYVWRHDRFALERLMNDKTASDTEHVQVKSYERLMALANEVAETEQACSELHVKVESKKASTRALVALRQRLGELKAERRHQLTALIRSDSGLRKRLAEQLRCVPTNVEEEA